MSNSGASMLGQLESVLVKLSAQLALVRPEAIFDLGEFSARLLRDLHDVESGIDVASHHRFVRSQDHRARYRAAGIFIELQPSSVFLLGPLRNSFLRAGLFWGRKRGAAGGTGG